MPTQSTTTAATVAATVLLLLTILNLSNTQSVNSQSRNPLPRFPCQPPQYDSYPFCNTSLPIPTRAQSLLSLLSLSDKISRLSNNDTGIPRLGIPPYQWWSESLHGIASNGPGVTFDNNGIPAATSFPQVLLTAAAFNRTLWNSIAKAIAVEARAMYNVGQAGLTFWAPNINIFRDPRWGRGQETPGEDPMVAAAYAIEYVRGFQGDRSGNAYGVWKKKTRRRRRVLTGGGEDELMLSACCKHFTAYDLEKWGNYTRYNFNAIVTEQDMQDTYQPPFRSCIHQGKASCLMCSYNSVNGIPACADQNLLQKARNEWDFKGYITSDCDAVATIYEYHNYTKTPEDAVAIALKAGTDINCGTYMLRHTHAAIEMGKVEEEDLDKALLNLFVVQFRLGLFDGDPKRGKFGKLGPQDVCTSEHKSLALEAARQGIVLLKNNNKFLPLKQNAVSSIAVIGPMANATSQLDGGYTGIPCSPTSVVEGLRTYVKKISHVSGCVDVSCTSKAGFAEAVSIARRADFVIIVAGLDLSQETEELDRFSLLLPGYQMALISAVAKCGKPLVLVLTGGGPLDVSFAQDDPRIASIIWVGYPGESGGKALAEIIFGDYNPGGKLPVTWYPQSFTKVPMSDMNMRSNLSRGYPGRTYRFYTGDRVYGFGHGLSYTNYTYNILSAPKTLSAFGSPKTLSTENILQQRGGLFNYLNVDELEEYCDSLRFYMEISVTNHGLLDGSVVVMLFARVPGSFEGAPLSQLVDFDRVHTISYSHTKTGILVDPCRHLSIVNDYGKLILPLGDHTLMLEGVEHILTIGM